jgi:tetratricopeptide (TPR) repeat protein
VDATAEDIAEREARLELERQLFASVEAKSEQLLPVLPGEDQDEELSKLLRFVRDSPDLGRIWQLARADALAEERQLFLDELRPRLSADVLYGSEGNVSLANMFFGFRKMAANFVWLQVDRYWHEGALHRMVPLMRTTVALDPQFVDAYLLGAWHLAFNITAGLPETPEADKVYNPKVGKRIGHKESFYYFAADFLREGIDRNPRDYRLYFDLGYRVYHDKLRDNERAALYLREAVRYRHDVWVPRTLYRILELNQQYEEALKGWRNYLERYPENEVAPRFIARNEAHIVQRDAQRAFEAAEEARAAGDRARAAELEQQARALWEDARQMWIRFMEIEGESPYGQARLHIMDAEELRKRGMFYDAVALLDSARWESGEMFEEISDIIIETKLEGGIGLSLSERMEMERRREAAEFRELEQARRQQLRGRT